MKIKVGVMGSAGEASPTDKEALWTTAINLANVIASHDVMLFTGATTGIVYVTGKAAHEAGTFHVGISPASNDQEHREKYDLPTDACDAVVYTGFGLKGRNVVLARSCDIVIFVAGSMGSLNELTIAHDEGKIIGCLTGTGGVADEIDYLMEKFAKKTGARVFQDADPGKLLESCLAELQRRNPSSD